MELWLMTQLEYLLRILVAALCGAMIGYERTSHMKTAGIRTHLIVSIASALMMLVSKYGFFDLIARDGISLDPSRIGAGVVTAIGFLGVGVIFVRKQNVSGLTTAAGLWATVGVGTAIGAGMYLTGVAAALLIVLLQVLLHRSNRLSREPVSQKLTLEVSMDTDAEALFAEIFESRHIVILSLNVQKLSDTALELKLLVRYPAVYGIADIMRLLKEIPSIKSIEL